MKSTNQQNTITQGYISSGTLDCINAESNKIEKREKMQKTDIGKATIMNILTGYRSKNINKLR